MAITIRELEPDKGGGEEGGEGRREGVWWKSEHVGGGRASWGGERRSGQIKEESHEHSHSTEERRGEQ